MVSQQQVPRVPMALLARLEKPALMVKMMLLARPEKPALMVKMMLLARLEKPAPPAKRVQMRVNSNSPAGPVRRS